MLNHCTVDPNTSYEIIAEMSEYQRYTHDHILTELFRQFISHTDLDLTTDLVQTHWLGEITKIEWFGFIHQRLDVNQGFHSIDDLVQTDPNDLVDKNLLALMTSHGIKIGSVKRLEQRHKNWLMHTFLCQAASRCNDLDLVKQLICCGADPLAIDHNRTALASIFVATDLELHYRKFGRDRSIFAAWQQLLDECGIDFCEYVQEQHFTGECYNSLRGHRLQLIDIKHDSVELDVTWTWPVYSKQHMPGTYPTDKIDKVCWEFRGRDSTWHKSWSSIQYRASDSRLLDNLGYQHSMSAQDDHDWVARTLLRPQEWSGSDSGGRSRSRVQRRHCSFSQRSHSQPRSLKGLKWIPHPDRSWLKAHYICPFTFALQESPWSCWDESTFSSEIGRCFGLSDNQPFDICSPRTLSARGHNILDGGSNESLSTSNQRRLFKGSQPTTVEERLIRTWVREFQDESSWRKGQQSSQ